MGPGVGAWLTGSDIHSQPPVYRQGHRPRGRGAQARGQGSTAEHPSVEPGAIARPARGGPEAAQSPASSRRPRPLWRPIGQGRGPRFRLGFRLPAGCSPRRPGPCAGHGLPPPGGAEAPELRAESGALHVAQASGHKSSQSVRLSGRIPAVSEPADPQCTCTEERGPVHPPAVFPKDGRRRCSVRPRLGRKSEATGGARPVSCDRCRRAPGASLVTSHFSSSARARFLLHPNSRPCGAITPGRPRAIRKHLCGGLNRTPGLTVPLRR